MRLAVWTSLPPQPGATSWQNALLLPELARHVEIVAVVDDWLASVARRPDGCELMGASEYRRGPRADLDVYHVDDDFEASGFAHAELLQTPGLLVLHDLSLYNFYRRAFATEELSLELEVWRNHGHEPDPASSLLLRRVVDASAGIVVDSSWARDEIQRRFPAATVMVIPPVVPARSLVSRDLRNELGWHDDTFVLGWLGPFQETMRPELTLSVLAACHHADSRVRLLMAGSVDDPAVLARLRQVIRDRALDDLVVVAADPAEDDLQASLDATDVLVDLGTATPGPIPIPLLRALQTGVPAVITDRPQLASLDPACCRRVPAAAGDATRGAVQYVLHAIRAEPHFRTARSAALAYAAHELALAPIAGRVVDAATQTCAAVSAQPRIREVTEPTLPLNIYGDFLATTGLMEAGRRLTSLLLETTLDIRTLRITTPGPTHSDLRVGPAFRTPADAPHFDADSLWLANINEFTNISDANLRPSGHRGRIIALWFWELPALPARFAEQIARVDEIWVASTFVQTTLRWYTTKPVHVVPLPIYTQLPVIFSRRDFDLPETSVVYFFNMDAHSNISRKNPFGLIRAFGRAFDANERQEHARLVIKCSNLPAYPAFDAALHQAVDNVNGVVIRDELSRSEMNALLASIDVYVSLHRSEGFGLGMAEAMAHGKPVVATAYSGNVDFTRPGSSCLVGYQLRMITDLDHEWWPEGAQVAYPPGFSYWAEPDLDAATSWLRLLFDQPRLRRRIGLAGAREIDRRYSSTATRHAVLDLLTSSRRTSLADTACTTAR